jgi:hypothetical protein
LHAGKISNLSESCSGNEKVPKFSFFAIGSPGRRQAQSKHHEYSRVIRELNFKT